MTFGTLIADTLPTTLSNSRNKRTNSFINITHYPPMANEKEQGQQLQIELTPEIANGTYSNLAIINHSPQEFVLDFIAALPGLPQARVNARQILTPQSAKRLLFALQDNVVKYENEFGTIDPSSHGVHAQWRPPLRTPQPAATEGVGRTATPFGAPDAKA